MGRGIDQKGRVAKIVGANQCGTAMIQRGVSLRRGPPYEFRVSGASIDVCANARDGAIVRYQLLSGSGARRRNGCWCRRHLRRAPSLPKYRSDASDGCFSRGRFIAGAKSCAASTPVFAAVAVTANADYGQSIASRAEAVDAEFAGALMTAIGATASVRVWQPKVAFYPEPTSVRF
jgi:hypothetical protein